MSEGRNAAKPKPPPAARLIARAEQVVLVLLALAVVGGIVWQVTAYHWAKPPEAVPPPGGPTYRINANQADWVTLTLVPGLGEKLAKKIVERRQARGGRFTSLDQLEEVSGIGDKTRAKLDRYLYAGDPDANDEPVEMPGEP